MKQLSAAIIVAAGAALVGASLWCASAIMALPVNHSIDIAHQGVTTGICIIIVGTIGWGYSLWSRSDS